MAPQNSARIKMWNASRKYSKRRWQRDCPHYYERGYCGKGDMCTSRHEPRAFGSTTECQQWKTGSCRLRRCPHRHSPYVDLNRTAPPSSRTASVSTTAIGDRAFDEDAIWGERCDRASFLPSRFSNALIQGIATTPANRTVKVLYSDSYHTECDLNVTVKVHDVYSVRDDDSDSDYYDCSVRSRSRERRPARERWRRERSRIATSVE